MTTLPKHKGTSALGRGLLPARGEWALFVVRFLGSAGFFAFIPFLGLWLTTHVGLSAASSGLVVSVAILTTRAGGLVLAGAINRLGLRRSVLASYAGTSAMFLCAAWTRTTVIEVWLAVAAILGLLHAMATTAMKVIISSTPTATAQIRGFSHFNLAVNGGAALGAAAGGGILALRGEALPLVSATAQGLAVLVAVALPRAVPPPARVGWRAYMPDRQLAVLLVLTSPLYLAIAQMTTVLPAYLGRSIGPAAVGFLFSVNAFVVIVAQLPAQQILTWLHADRGSAMFLLFAGVGTAAALVLTTAGERTGMAILLIAMVVMSLAEVIWSPLLDTEVNARRAGMSLAAAYGASGLIWGALESAGSSLGYGFIGAGRGAEGYWITAICVVLGLLAYAVIRRRSPTAEGCQ